MKNACKLLLLMAALPLAAPAAELTLEQIMSDPDWSSRSRQNAVWNADRDSHVWTYLGDVCLSDGDSQRQITRTVAQESWASFMADGRLN